MTDFLRAVKMSVRFLILGAYSPSRVVIGVEPLPAPTLAGRWRQWRAMLRLAGKIRRGERGWMMWVSRPGDDGGVECRVIERHADGTVTVVIP